MKRTRHSPEQIIAKLRDADTLLATVASIGQVCQKLEFSEVTFHRWRDQYGGMMRGDTFNNQESQFTEELDRFWDQLIGPDPSRAARFESVYRSLSGL